MGCVSASWKACVQERGASLFFEVTGKAIRSSLVKEYAHRGQPFASGTGGAPQPEVRRAHPRKPFFGIPAARSCLRTSLHAS